MVSHEDYMRKAIVAAETAAAKGNLPFGCVLVNGHGEILETGENEINTSGDAIAHAEIVLIHKLARKYSRTDLSKCTIYTTDEPCPMCASAIYWSGIGALVYGLRKSRYYDNIERTKVEFVFEISAGDILSHGGRLVRVEGPVLEDEVIKLHRTN